MTETQVLREQARVSKAEYGSDLLVELLASLGMPYIALNPGSSYRGIHDSLVNFEAPGKPEIILCTHEEAAIGIARGYAAATGKPLLAGLHDFVGLQHATMGIYSAWGGRLPMIVIGGAHAMAAENRPTHIEWMHTALVQGNVVRDFVKWDDQPGSIGSFPESVMRGYRIAMTEPRGPVYLCFDSDLQEARVTQPVQLPDPKRYAPPAPIAPDPASLQEAARLLAGAQSPVIIADGVGRHHEAVPHLAALAELLQAPVVSVGGSFNIATNHPLNLTAMRVDLVKQADVVLALDVFDLRTSLGEPIGREEMEMAIGPDTRVIHINVWDLMQHSLTTDFEGLMPVDLPISADTSVALPLLVEQCRKALGADTGSRARIEARGANLESLRSQRQTGRAGGGRNGSAIPIPMEHVSAELAGIVKSMGVPFTFSGGPRSGAWEITQPEQLVGSVPGGGLGIATGAAIGVSLAYKDAGRMTINMVGDGEMLYTPSTLWTAANIGAPLLTIVNNNRSYGSDEGYQEYMAIERGRPVENKGVGIYIENPDTNFAAMAGSFGVEGFGPVEDPAKLHDVLEQAVKVVAIEKRPALVDVRTPRRAPMGG